MDSPFKIKRNDTLPVLNINIQTRGTLDQVIPFNLSAVTACTFTMSDGQGNLKVSSASAFVYDSDCGTLQYSWATGDTDTAGQFQGEFEMFFSGGKKMSIPTLGSIDILIVEDLNNN